MGTLAGSTGKDVWVVSGDRCDATVTSGCSATPVSLSAGNGPAGLALDPSAGTLYVSSEDGSVSAIDTNTCNGQAASGCGKPGATVEAQIDPRGDAFDAASNTLYVTNAGSNTVSMIDTTTCNAQSTSGCTKAPPSFPVGASPRRIVIDPDDHTAYIVNTGGNSVSMIDTESCNATDQSGCPSEPAPGTASAIGLAHGVGSLPAQDSTCSPTTAASSSGAAPSEVTAGSHQVGSGTIDGMSWTLWSKNGQTGADALENAGLVVDGHGYGLCPGYPNPAEMELLDAGGKTIVYGVIGYPGKATIKLTTGTTGTFTPGKPLPAPAVQAANGVSFFIGTLPKSACSYSALELDSTSGKISAEHNLGFGACTPGKLSPITFSQGIWQLPAGHFVSNFPGATGRGAPIVPGPLADSTCSPRTDAAGSGGPESEVTTGAHRVASGTVEGMTWTLWSKNGQSGAEALENAGLVVGGHAYGLCPGFANPAELELLDAGGKTIVFGVVGYPGRTRIKLTTGTTGTFTPGKPLQSPAVRHANGVSFFIGSLPKPPCSLLRPRARLHEREDLGGAQRGLRRLHSGKAQPDHVQPGHLAAPGRPLRRQLRGSAGSACQERVSTTKRAAYCDDCLFRPCPRPSPRPLGGAAFPPPSTINST